MIAKRTGRAGRLLKGLLVWLGLVALAGALRAQDIVLADFEATNYAWLPGGSWTVTGSAMGPGPAQGTLAGQQAVSGYLGKGLVNTFYNGDASTGTLTSPPFTITRTYLKFLIGAGNHRTQTCVNLLVGGKVVFSAVGMGDREALDWLQWNVSGYLNQTAQLQIVDACTNGWGHINVDQITETATSLPNRLVATNHYLNLPVSYAGPSHLVELLQNGLVIHEFNLALVTNGTPDYYAFLDLTAFQGELLVRVDSAAANASQLTALVQATNILTTTPIYQETTRPVYHYTARRGWLNDPNGMVFYDGQYHLYYQHNPYGTEWDNMHWGSAVSTNLVQWQELPEALYPDWLGAMWSGSAVVDENNSAGFGTNALVAFYTAAGGHSNNPRMSAGQLFTQCLAYSLDQGVTWTKYTNNPVIPNLVGGDNRDPKVIWYAPGNKWVLVLWLNNHDFGFFSSTDLKHWTQTSTFTFPGVIEVPELFQLPLDGNPNNLSWVFWAGAGNYYTGQFDGNTFTALNGPNVIRQGNSMAAAQTFNNIPAADGRRILISQGTVNFTGVPFNSIMNFPVVLTLQSAPSGPWLDANPVAEIAQLRLTTNTWPAQSLVNGANALAGMSGEAFDLDAQFQPGATNQVVFNLAGTPVVYNAASRTVACAGLTNALSPSNGVVHLRFLVDRGSVEIFGNGGFLYMPMSVTPVAGPQPLGMTAIGSGVQLVSLSLYHLGTTWATAANVPPPAITGQPASVTTDLGGPAGFNVTATGLGALTYQWLSNGVPVVGATLPNLNLYPVSGASANYSVMVANSGGAVTSSVAPLTVIPPYNVACWRMEAQITAPNSAGVGAFTGVVDSDTTVGQGIYTTGILPAAIDDLITFNGLPGNPVTLATNTAPSSMFVNAHGPGSFSYDAESITNVDGALFFPQDQYGDEMDFTGPFSIELFFATDGNQSGAGTMELAAQGTDTGQTFRYGIDMNEAATGGVRFKVANASLGLTNYVDLAGANYADGQWHYLLAVCDTLAGTNGQLRLTIANADGSLAVATNNLPAGFLPLPATDNGNLFLGRNTYPLAANPQTFRGFLDEVQITAGVVPDAWRIGNTVLVANAPVAAPGSPVYGGTAVTLSETPTGRTPFFFQWQVNGINVPGATNSSLVLPGLAANTTNYYSVVVSNNTAASLSPSLTLVVNAASAPQFATQPSPPSATNYLNGLATFTVGVAGSQPISLQWQHNGTNLSGQTAPALTVANLRASDAGAYSVIAANAEGTNASQPAFLTVLPLPTSAPPNVTTFHNDNTRAGANTNEFLLTLANVNVNTFGRLFSYALDGYVYAQPLYVANLNVPGQGVHNVVFVATEHDSIYALDADSNAGPNGGVLWHVTPGIAPLSNNHEFGQRYGNGNYLDIVPEVGITGTPVIDPVAGVLYVNVLSREVGATTNYYHRLHALSLTNGMELPNSPVVVSASVPGRGVDSSNGVVRFNARQENARPGLTLAGGLVYVAYGSFADTDPYHGWVIGFNATTLQPVTNLVYNTTPNATVAAFGANAAEGALWMAGDGLCVDAATNLYFETGNGSFSANTNGGDYSDSFVKLATTNGLRVADYFTPYNQAGLSAADEDLGSGGPLLLPDAVGGTAHPHLLVGCGKEGKIYLLDRDNLGKYNPAADTQIVQEIPNAVGGTWSCPAYFNGLIYYQGLGDVLKAFAISNSVIATTPVSAAATSYGGAGGTPSISASGMGNAIAWSLQPDAFASGGPAVLHAYNATNLAQELYNSSLNPTRDNPGGAVKMTTPTIANGKVYVGGQYVLSVFGNGVFQPTPVIVPAGGLFTNAVTVTLSDTSPGVGLYYTLDGTLPTTNSTLYTAALLLTNSASLQVIASLPGTVASAVASASFSNSSATGTGAGLTGEYWTNTPSAAFTNLAFNVAPTLTRTDAVVNFNWNTTGPDPRIGQTVFTARWLGSVEPQYNETYTFSVTADDGVRLWLNGQLLVDAWLDQAPTTYQGSITLKAQQLYNIRMDYYQGGGGAEASLAWSSPSTPLAVIPPTQLYPYTNPPPAVVLLSPTNAAAYTASASVTLGADADAPFNPLSQVSFYANGTLLGTAASPPYTLTATGLAAGNYALTAVAVDGSGLGATSAPVNITVLPATGQPYGLTTNAALPAFLNLPTTYQGPLPLLLSQTGVFSNTPAMIPTNGLIPYVPNTPLWSDGALKARYFSVPGSGAPPTPGQQITFAPTGSWTFPAGSVFVKTFTLNTDTSNPGVVRRLETRLLVRDINGAVYGVTYKWRTDNSDADLLSNRLNETITITNATGLTTQTWYYPSPADCLTCHTPVANYVLGLNTRQLNGNNTYPATGVTDNQLRTLNRLGLLNPAFDEATITNLEKMSALTNLTATLQDRSRSYLDANCAQCHQPGGTGISFDARYDTQLASQNITNYPAAVTLGYDHACIVRSQDVWRSMIYARVNTTNAAYKMPPLARNLIDTNAVAVFAGWINLLPGIPALAPPVINPNGGNYQASVPVSVVDPNTNATIYYTLDGSLPTTNSLRFPGSLTFYNNATLAASAFAPGYNNSVAASALFLVQPVAFTSQGFSNQVFQLGFTGIPGSNYVLQTTTNLINWAPLATNTALTNQFIWFDWQATNYPHRFYRVFQP